MTNIDLGLSSVVGATGSDSSSDSVFGASGVNNIPFGYQSPFATYTASTSWGVGTLPSTSTIFERGTVNAQGSLYIYPPAAPWLATVQRRLSNSIGAIGGAAVGSGEWLARDVVFAANTLFQATSDLFPTEPHLSSSRTGDLVAEFQGAHGRLTLIVSAKMALAFVVTDNNTTEARIPLTVSQPIDLRAALAGVTSAVRGQRRGDLGPS